MIVITTSISYHHLTLKDQKNSRLIMGLGRKRYRSTGFFPLWKEFGGKWKDSFPWKVGLVMQTVEETLQNWFLPCETETKGIQEDRGRTLYFDRNDGDDSRGDSTGSLRPPYM